MLLSSIETQQKNYLFNHIRWYVTLICELKFNLVLVLILDIVPENLGGFELFEYDKRKMILVFFFSCGFNDIIFFFNEMSLKENNYNNTNEM